MLNLREDLVGRGNEAVVYAIAAEIYDAKNSNSEIDVLALAESIFECLFGAGLDPAPLRSGASLAAMRDWLNRFKGENPGVLPKPRISIRAATQHAA